MEALKGALHPDSAALRFNIGNVLMTMTRFDEAEPYYLQALERREKLLGPEHPDVAESLTGLGDLWKERGQPGKALSYLARSLEIYTRKAPGTLSWAMTEGDMADCLRGLGRYDEALAHARAGLNVLEARLGRDHAYVAMLLIIWGDIELERGRAAEAVAPLERAVAISASQGEPV